MKTLAAKIAVILSSLLLSSVACADDDDYRYERHGHRHHHEHDYARPEVVYAPVIYVEPLYQVVRRARPRRECWSTTDAYRSGGYDDSATGLVLGGVLGGVIGHNIAQGRDRDVAVLAGTLLGATIGHDLGHATAAVPVTRTHCEAENDYDEVEQVSGYRVQYRYFGRIYETRTDRDPGARVRVTVNIGD
jgi:uncharacterized protein YcfJ